MNSAESPRRCLAAASVLEVGSGPGRDADQLEARGLCVRRTDATRAFVDLLRADGVRADVLNVVTDDLGGAYDAMFANAVLLHLTRQPLAVVLGKAATAVEASPWELVSIERDPGTFQPWLIALCRRPATPPPHLASRPARCDR